MKECIFNYFFLFISIALEKRFTMHASYQRMDIIH